LQSSIERLFPPTNNPKHQLKIQIGTNLFWETEESINVDELLNLSVINNQDELMSIVDTSLVSCEEKEIETPPEIDEWLISVPDIQMLTNYKSRQEKGESCWSKTPYRRNYSI
jgi:hypothetical protein